MFEASSFWAVVTWLPTRSDRAWWTTIAVLDTLTLAGRVSLHAVGLVALHVLRQYAKRLTGLAKA